MFTYAKLTCPVVTLPSQPLFNLYYTAPAPFFSFDSEPAVFDLFYSIKAHLGGDSQNFLGKFVRLFLT